MVPVHLNGIPVCGLVNTGSILTVISGRVARLLSHYTGVKAYPTTTRLGDFGAFHSAVDPGAQMTLEISLIGCHEQFLVQVLEDMEFDCVIGLDVISRMKIHLDYDQRMVSTPIHKQRMLTRGEVIWMVTRTADSCAMMRPEDSAPP